PRTQRNTEAAMYVTVMSTGEEVLRGEVTDRNAAYLSARLTERGYPVQRHVAVGDCAEALAAELGRAAEEGDLVVITGGLGPTEDDCVREAVAQVAGRELVEHPDLKEALRERVGEEALHKNLCQALVPEDARLFRNESGTAWGFACRADGCWIVALPGVPSEMREMFSGSVLSFLLDELPPGRCVASRRLSLFGIPESEVNRRLGEMTGGDRNPRLGLTAVGGTIRVTITAEGATQEEAERLAEKDLAAAREEFGRMVVGEGETTLAGAVKRLLDERGHTIGAAESCTGGLIGDMLTDEPGISEFFLDDVVAYSNEAKIHRLGVPREQIVEHGAVSPQVAESMARGACETGGADVAVSTTGIAGPTGGTPEKPVGLVYVGVSTPAGTEVRELHIDRPRRKVKLRAAKHALNELRLALMDSCGSGGE
ncbi:MAG: competence/damage-inducible protein A, partial [Planctomycetota bacterium]